MNDKTVGGIHWSFWIIIVVTLIFNIMGVINYFVQMNADSLASFPEKYRPIIEGRPAWATAAFAIAVFGGSLGSLLLLLRKSAAYCLFIASLLGAIVTMTHTLGIASSVIDFSAFEILMMILMMMHIFGVAGLRSFEIWIGVLMQLVVTAFLIWYSKLIERKGWIS